RLITGIEDLPYEILYEVLNYFNGHEQVEEFSNLNYQFIVQMI
ncbi:unnamed protein product, partial [Rotaria socialis]